MESLSIVFPGPGQVELRERKLPRLHQSDVLVECDKSLVSAGTERTALYREFDAGSHWDRWVKYPFRPGYSAVGTVHQVGRLVSGLAPGDRVALRCSHQQRAVVPATAVQRVESTLTNEEVAWFALATIAQVAVRRAAHELGDRVVVVGLGTLGQLVIQYLRLLGCSRVIAVGTNDVRLALAARHGASDVVQGRANTAGEEVRRMTEGGADVVYDVTGDPSVLEACLDFLHPLGRIVLLGDTGYPSRQRINGALVQRGLTVLGAHDSNAPSIPSTWARWTHENMAELFFTYLGRRDMDVADLTTHVVSPETAGAIYEAIHDAAFPGVGVVFDWTQL